MTTPYSLKATLTLLTTLLLVPLAALPAAESATPRVAPDATFSQIAQPSGFTPEMPKLSDVCMRLFALNQKGVPAERMLAAGNDFHITRGVWSYIECESFIKSVRAKGWEFQGSVCMTLTDPDRTKLKQYYKIGRGVLNCLYPWAVDGRGWLEAFGSLERKPQNHRLHLSNISANRIKNVLQHDIGDIGQLQLDNVMTTDVPNPISVVGDAKIEQISSTKKSEK